MLLLHASFTRLNPCLQAPTLLSSSLLWMDPLILSPVLQVTATVQQVENDLA